MFLNVPIARQIRTGAQLQVGDIIRNPRTGSQGVVIGGSEFTDNKLARLLTTRDGRRQDIAVQSWVNGKAHMFSVPKTSTYEYINTVEGVVATA